jgi:hypothetical protein
MASHYGITAIPTAADPPTVNGFVETWYDQSGNGNDVTQTTADRATQDSKLWCLGYCI